MAITEASRHRLYQRLEEVLETAIARLGDRVRVELAEVRVEMATLRADSAREQRNLMVAVVAANTSLAGLAFAAGLL